MLIIHHTDLDGFCSAALIKKAVEPEVVEFMPMNYGYKIDWDTIVQHEVVYMVDFSFENFEDMLKLQNMVKKFIWIDHHESSYNKWKEAGSPQILGTRVSRGTAGCELTYEYLHPKLVLEKLMPGYVTLLGRYDVWDHSDPDTVPFQYGMRVEETFPDSPIWDKLIADEDTSFTRGIIETGKSILKYEDQQNKYKGKSARTIKFLDYTVVALNQASVNNNTFAHCYNPEVHDLMLAFSYSDKEFWRISLRSAKGINVAEIANQFGGGGHAGAAGFQLSTQQLIELGIIV